jgi:hypothetical protein
MGVGVCVGASVGVSIVGVAVGVDASVGVIEGVEVEVSVAVEVGVVVGVKVGVAVGVGVGVAVTGRLTFTTPLNAVVSKGVPSISVVNGDKTMIGWKPGAASASTRTWHLYNDLTWIGVSAVEAST